MMTKDKFSNYEKFGCGRCKFTGTPQCKVNTWIDHIKLLRKIVLDSGLTEEIKWGSPCYSINKKNVLMILAFKENCGISFFKGSLLKDSKKILQMPGENSQNTRMLKFTNIKEIQKIQSTIKDYIKEAIEIEASGKKPVLKDITEYEIPEELKAIFKENSKLKKAFEALTPGRQKGYLIFFSGAKQSATRRTRIEKYIPQILEGKGMYD